MRPDPDLARRQDAALARLRLQVASGARPTAIADLPPDVRPAVRVADRVGAALLPVVDAATDAHRQRQQVARQVRTATAPARTVAVGLVLLPLLAVPALAGLLDVDLVGFYTSGVGAVVGLVALGLWAVGTVAIVGLVRHAGRDAGPVGPTPRVVVAGAIGWLLHGPWLALVAAMVARSTFRAPPAPPHRSLADACDLVAAALSAGLAAPAALREAALHVSSLADDLRRLAWQVELGRLTATGRPDAAIPAECARLAQVLADGLAAGGPLVPALRALARDVRAERGAAAEAAALRLPARLTFPTALLVLPATVLAIGAPIVVTGLAAFSGP